VDEFDSQIAAANAYESALVPALFRDWPPRIVEAAKIGTGQRVLDVACGTGVLARAVAVTVGGSGSVVGLDRNPGMLAVAKRIAPTVEWREGVAEQLPFRDASFDAVVSQFGLMFFADRAAALREMWRVLRPGGRLAVAVWASLDDTPAYAAEVALLDRAAGAAAADALRAPFALGARDQLAALFAIAGVPLARIATQMVTARFPNPRIMVEIDLRGWLPVAGVPLPEPVIAQVLEQAESALRDYVISDGTVRFPMPAQIAIAARPVAG
jgi:SAM-dependent methyltransferase